MKNFSISIAHVRSLGGSLVNYNHNIKETMKPKNKKLQKSLEIITY
jgi:hypothetical protein